MARKKTIVEPGRNKVRYLALYRSAQPRIGIPEIALQHAGHPLEISHDSRTIEADFVVESGNCLRGSRLPKNRLSEASRQHFQSRKDDDRNHKQRKDAKRQAVQYCSQDRMQVSLPG